MRALTWRTARRTRSGPIGCRLSATTRQDVAQDALIRFAGGPALGTLPVPDLALELRGLVRIPDRIQAHARLAQAADRPRVGDAGVDDSPGIDEAARPKRMARHRRPSGQQELVEAVRDTRSRAAASATVREPRSLRYSFSSRRTCTGSGLISSNLVVAVVVPGRLRHIEVHVIDGQARAFAGARLERLSEPSEIVGRHASPRTR